MAREYVKSWFSIFTDEDFGCQPYSDKWLYQVLLGQPALNYAGIQPINLRRWRKAMRTDQGLPSETDLMVMLLRMERRGYVYTDDDTGEVLARAFMRVDQVYRQPNLYKSALRALSHLESPKLAAVMLTELDRIPVLEVKSAKLADEISDLRATVRTHLETLSEGLTEPFLEPFREPLAEGFPRPGKTEGLPEPLAEGFPEGSVEVEVEVVNSPSEVVTLGSNTREAQNDTLAAGPGTNGPHQEPPRRCKAHRTLPADAPVPNCGACANFRKAHERWEARQRDAQARAVHAEALARSQRAREVAELRAAEIERCDLCDDDGYLVGDDVMGVCTHNPDQAATNTAGMAKVREAMTRPKRATA